MRKLFFYGTSFPKIFFSWQSLNTDKAKKKKKKKREGRRKEKSKGGKIPDYSVSCLIRKNSFSPSLSPRRKMGKLLDHKRGRKDFPPPVAEVGGGRGAGGGGGGTCGRFKREQIWRKEINFILFHELPFFFAQKPRKEVLHLLSPCFVAGKNFQFFVQISFEGGGKSSLSCIRGKDDCDATWNSITLKIWPCHRAFTPVPDTPLSPTLFPSKVRPCSGRVREENRVESTVSAEPMGGRERERETTKAISLLFMVAVFYISTFPPAPPLPLSLCVLLDARLYPTGLLNSRAYLVTNSALNVSWSMSLEYHVNVTCLKAEFLALVSLKVPSGIFFHYGWCVKMGRKFPTSFFWVGGIQPNLTTLQPQSVACLDVVYVLPN